MVDHALPLSHLPAKPNQPKESLTIMNNRLKSAALSLGVAVLFGPLLVGCGGTDTVAKPSESQHSETVTAAPAPAVVMAQPAPVSSEHASSNSTSSETSPNGSSTSEKSSSSKSTTY